MKQKKVQTKIITWSKTDAFLRNKKQVGIKIITRPKVDAFLRYKKNWD